MQATYSPDDNKLRLYAETRLDRPTYDRVRSAGFRWAPKQELFVAPAWSPDREDLLIDLCGDIEDEDKSLVERAEERAGRFSDYSANRAEDAAQARAAVSAIAENIPLGQPILVGHHSERHARRDAEKIQNGMRRTIKLWDQSIYWKERARGALRNAKYKERPDVRARRIRVLQAERRRWERTYRESKALLAAWEKASSLEEARRMAGGSEAGWLFCCETEGLRWHACDVLRPDEEHHPKCPTWTLPQVQERARAGYGASMANAQRWMDHTDRRLEYEQAMLEEAGGTVADRKGPEKGGAVKCWASHRGGWSWIVKVNRISVSVLDNWGNGGPNFTRTIPFDKLAGVMSPAEVEQARQEKRLFEYHDKTGFALADAPGDTAKAEQVAAETAEGRHARIHVEAIRSAGSECDCKDCKAAGVGAPAKLEIESMRKTLEQGIKVVSAPNLFPTPHEIARRMVDLADIGEGDRVLEPSAGTGNIASAVARFARCSLLCVEINRSLADGLARTGYVVQCADFLECNGDLGLFDAILMNPPFDHGQDVKHILHALGFLKPGGRLVAICANGPKQASALQPMAEVWEPLEPGTFPGTQVASVLLMLKSQL